MTSPPFSAPPVTVLRPTSPSLASGTYSYSLIPKTSHAKAIIAVIEAPLTFDIVAHIAACVRDVVPESAVHDSVQPCITHASHPSSCPTLESFIATTILCSGVQIPTLLGMLVLLQRLKNVLPIGVHARSYCTLHRLFITTLMLASKSFNDRSPSNDLWSNFSGSVFSPAELLSMEREMLYRLDYAVTIRDEVALLLSAMDLGAALGADMPESELHPISSEGKQQDRDAVKTRHSRESTVVLGPVAASAHSLHVKPALLGKSDEAFTFSIPETPPLVPSDSSWTSSSSSGSRASESSGGPSVPSTLGMKRSLSSSTSAPDLASLRHPPFSRRVDGMRMKHRVPADTVAIELGETEEAEGRLGYRLMSSRETINAFCSERDNESRMSVNPSASLSYTPLLVPSPASASASILGSSWSSSRSSSSVFSVSPGLMPTHAASIEAKIYQQPESALSSRPGSSVEHAQPSTSHADEPAISTTSTSGSDSPLHRSIPQTSLMNQVLHRQRNRLRQPKDGSSHHFRGPRAAIHL